MLFLLSLLVAAAAEECDHTADCSNGVSLLTLRSTVSYRAAVEMWTLISQISAMGRSAVEQELEIQEWSDENQGLKRAVIEMQADASATSSSGTAEPSVGIFGYAEPTPEPTPVASAEDTAGTPTVIPGINEIDTNFEMKEREGLSVKPVPTQTESMEHAEWIDSLKAARDASRHLENTSELSKFIQAQEDSNEACHAKELEAKRTLDGIASKVLMLSDEVEGQESMVEAQAQMVKDMLARGARSTESKKAEHHECNVQYNESWDDLQRYRNEIIELHNIANPKLRSRIAHGGLDHHVNYSEEAEVHADNVRAFFNGEYQTDDWEGDVNVSAVRQEHADFEDDERYQYSAHGRYAEHGHSKPRRYGAGHTAGRYSRNGGRYALIEVGENSTEMNEQRNMPVELDVKKSPSFVSQETCEHLKRFYSRAAPNYISQAKFDELDCQAQRETLQKTFSEAYLNLITLVETGEEAAEQEKATCYGIAYDKDDSQQMGYQAKINKASAWIQAAKDTLTTILPILENAKKEFEMLEDHIDNLKKTCVVDDDVTDHLRRVRRLIGSLDHCPGRNDFKLVIPGTGETPAAPAQSAGS